MTADVIVFVAAAGFGAVIGLERQTGKHDESVLFGARTFALYGLWGAFAAYLGQGYGTAALAVAAAGFLALVVAAYVISSRRSGDYGTTTEAAACAAFLTGILAFNEQWVTALAVAIGTAALLRSKEPIHRLTDRFTDEDVRAVLQFGVITALVLPLVPDTDLGPYGAFNPREIWLMVVLISAIGLAGYAALRWLGSKGLVLTGLLGGLVSSTAVTLGYSRMARTGPELSAGLAAGVLAASTVMYPRVLGEAAVVAPSLARSLLIPLAAMGVVVGGAAVYTWLRHGRHDDVDPKLEVKNPLTLGVALGFGLLYAAIVFFSEMLLNEVSVASVQLVGAISGINDVDAVTLSTANLVQEGLDPTVGARTVLIAVTVNTAVKGGLAWVLGGVGRYRRIVVAALAPAAMVGFVLWTLL
jgi:uncharacterized membrane protein (DUF4010 family)